MRKTLFLVTLVAGVTACHKDATLPLPTASFSINGDSSQTYIAGTYDGFTVTNNSLNAQSYLWDLGNGITFTTKEFSYSYPKSGRYKITLTSINADDRRTQVVKTVTIKDRILKQIVITSINFKSALGFLKTTYPAGKANIWVEIQQAEPGRWDYQPLSNGGYDVPVVYKSDVVPNADSKSVPVTLIVSKKIVIDIATLSGGMGYGLNLFAQDATGTYLLTSSYGSGIGNAAYGNIHSGKYTVTSGFEGSNIVLNCDFE
jgi:PKD repeat protein